MCSTGSIARTCSARRPHRPHDAADACPRSTTLRSRRRLAPDVLPARRRRPSRASSIGCALVHRKRAGMIVETEAYLGPEDLASHARFGPTARTSVMFGPGGVSYVYLCYGIHEMFNIVTGADGRRSGRADPRGRAARRPARRSRASAAVPARSRRRSRSIAVTIARTSRAVSCSSQRHAEAAGARRPGRASASTYAGAWAAKPLRFWWRDHPSVSRVKTS